MMGEKMKLIKILNQEIVHLYNPVLFLMVSLEARVQLVISAYAGKQPPWIFKIQSVNRAATLVFVASDGLLIV